ncbi:hypothetical protein BCON_0119g00380 [Botryotinia convoluta]|uniref:Uncharacterized protein n=1 Tax=Botryotinia convoluta TaxID=54673 RepID=A0A4Z1HYG8_9HELO|nr:hypothetical protein BCON_0119g00380 [Botryotinia convoluta]
MSTPFKNVLRSFTNSNNKAALEIQTQPSTAVSSKSTSAATMSTIAPPRAVVTSHTASGTAIISSDS